MKKLAQELTWPPSLPQDLACAELMCLPLKDQLIYYHKEPASRVPGWRAVWTIDAESMQVIREGSITGDSE